MYKLTGTELLQFNQCSLKIILEPAYNSRNSVKVGLLSKKDNRRKNKKRRRKRENILWDIELNHILDRNLYFPT